MEDLIRLLAALLLDNPQATPTFRRFPIGQTGSSVCLMAEEAEFDVSLTPTHDVMYIHESREGAVEYGVIAIELFQPADDLEHAAGILGQFMNSLHSTFDIEHHTGLVHGHTLAVNQEVRGIVDYWQDTEGVDWKVKGWTNGQVVSVLYVKNINELPVHRQDFFLDSFQFAGA